MGIKTYNPYTPSRRQMTGSDFSEITKETPEKSLVVALKEQKQAVTTRVKSQLDTAAAELRRKYRIIDFKRKKTEFRQQ